MAIEVNIYGMRHGEKAKEGDALTPNGREQVALSCRKNLGRTPIQGYYSSLRARGVETTEVAQDNTLPENYGMPIHRRAAFDYCTATGIANTSAVAGAVKEYRAKNGNPPETLADWIQAAPAWVDSLQERVLQGLKNVAIELAFDAEDGEIRNAVVGSHSPTIELAAYNPDRYWPDPTFPRLQEADIAHYCFLVTKENGEITNVSLKSTTYIPRGF